MALDREIAEQQQALLATNRRTLAHLLQQAAQYGGEAFALPQTFNGIAVARAQIQSIKAYLRASGVIVDDELGDEARAEAVRVEDVALSLGEQTGAIVVYAKKEMRGESITLRVDPHKDYNIGAHVASANIVERSINSQSVFAAIFPRILPGDYTLFLVAHLKEVILLR
jgi:hypothetical protein